MAKALSYFNPRPREEGDRTRIASACQGGYFNPRPREEGDEAHKSERLERSYFNPRPREEGDAVGVWQELVFLISIHALVKRATIYTALHTG